MPALAKLSVARPSAPVSRPPTEAPASGAPVAPLVARTEKLWPVRAEVGPVRFSAWALEKASYTHSTSSPVPTRCWQPPTIEDSKLLKWPQNSDELLRVGADAV